MDEKLWQSNPPFFREEYNQPEPTLTPYLLESGKQNGAVIIFPGGAYAGRAAHEGKPVAEMLNAAGFSAFVLNYRVSPYRHPVMLTDALRAVRYVRCHAARFSIDPQKIGVLGFSAGGHLACCAINLFDYGIEDGDVIDKISSRPNAGVLCYPVISMLAHTHGGSRVNLLGDNAAQSLLESLSGEKNVREDCPPVFLWHTAQDQAVHVGNSLHMAVALKEKNIPFELHVFPNGCHGLGLARQDESVGQWSALLVNWLRKIGF